MEMVPYSYFDGGDADWYHGIGSFPPLRSSSSPLALSEEDDLLAVIAPPGPRNLEIRNSNLASSSDHVPLLLPVPDDSSSSSAMILRNEESHRLPVFPAAYDPSYYFDGLPPLPETAGGLDDPLMLQPFSDIDLDAFGGADEHIKASPPADDIMIVVPADRPYAAGQVAGVDGGNGDPKPVATVADCYHPPADSVDFGMAAMRYGERSDQASSVAALPPPMPRLRHQVRMRSGTDPAGKTRLDHIGFNEIRKYFYMPITKAAREMNVGLTVLKKRCRELGVARWPHRKMKSLKALILNVQEMGKGMSPAAVQRELAALETYCALMEADPSIELTDQTKKLRQACFKESYKRRRAASFNGKIDHIYNFGHELLQAAQGSKLTPQESSGASAGRSVPSSHLFGY